ncbi:mitotic apparatus protein p62-like isoform X2 [Pomacea canaliculata]|uniref:mitotic apparatus protein p62-like isoform X2 n=1 Tax=Pomacea canaliculata TaxID=400727 RepID=UPI000D735AE2|nr:mitotic apparatus protein p62-like isoform X2 [Pomacea canaliculata]
MSLDASMLDRSDSVEYFWGGELTRDKPELIWDMKGDISEDEDDDDFAIHTLFLKVVTLGKAAVSKEENIVQVEAVNYNNITVKQPLVNMVAGVNNTVALDMSFSGKFKTVFRLTEGSGPVYLSGHHLVEVPKEDFSQDDSFNGDEVTEISEEHDDDDDEEGVSKLKSKSKKRRGSGSSSPHTKVSKPKKSKMEPKDSDSEEDEDSEDSEWDDHFDLSSARKKKGKAGQSKKEKGSATTSKAGKKAKKPPAKK